jgi:hypothetical protein
MERDIDELVESQRKMRERKGFKYATYDERALLSRMNDRAKTLLDKRTDMNHIIVNHRDILENPDEELEKISEFFNKDMKKGIEAIDLNLWRNKIA